MPPPAERRGALPLAIFAAAAAASFGLSARNESPTASAGGGFTSLAAEDTGIDFANTIVQTPQVNLYTFEYLFNGGGVAIGDLDRDGLPDLYFTSTLGPDRLYRNLGGFRFRDITAAAGIAHTGGIKTGVVMADADGDGWLDIYVCRTGHPPDETLDDLLYLNQRDLTFRESAASLGLSDRSTTTHAVFFDYDLDADLDLFLLNQRSDFRSSNQARLVPSGDGGTTRLRGAQTPHESDRLFRNDGGRFTDVSREAGIDTSAFGLGVAVTDLDGDRRPDIYVANDYIEPDIAYVNRGDGTFADRQEAMFRHTSHSSMGVDAADFDNDGFVDLVVVDMAAEDNYRHKALLNIMYWSRYAVLASNGYGHQLARNVLQRSNRDGTFSEIGELAGVARTDWSWAPLLADFDNDGWKDLFVTNGFRYDVTNADYLKYTLEELRRRQAAVGDEPLEAYLSHIPTAKLGNYLFRNRGTLPFENVSRAWGVDRPSYSSGAAYGDLDRDGDLDLVVSVIDERALVYRNEARRDPARARFLQVALEGPPGNRLGFGARLEIRTAAGLQMAEMQPSRGFESSVEPLLHFGLGELDSVSGLELRWPDGRTEVRRNVAADQRLTLRWADAVPRGAEPAARRPAPPAPLFRKVEGAVDRRHRENLFIDFKREPLLPHMLSRSGPCQAVGDLDGDGLDDLYVGGAAGQPGAVFLQDRAGRLREVPEESLAADRAHEDTGAALFDADGDGDLDLYVVSGGNEFDAGDALYQDRLYANDGRGRLTRMPSSLPVETASGSCVRPADYDGDGDLDLFVGGRVVPASYPSPPRSLLLRNDGGRFQSVEALSPAFRRLGMVTSAAWADFERDGFPDLAVAGEWMPLTLLRNRRGSFEDVTAASGFDGSEGWWTALAAGDLDGDGDLDLAAGNLGRNSRLRATDSEPLRIYAADFDRNGSLDAILSWHQDGREYPLPQRDLLLTQLPSLKKKFLRYETYARATMADVLPAADLAAALRLEARQLDTGLFENLGGRFRFRPLPVEAQVAPVQDILIDDFDGDERTDLLLVGNSFGTEVESGRYDASDGLFLRGGASLEFTPVHSSESGFKAPGDGRSLARLRRADGIRLYVVGRNDDDLLVFAVPPRGGSR